MRTPRSAHRDTFDMSAPADDAESRFVGSSKHCEKA
jgi:hypothetical protein